MLHVYNISRNTPLIDKGRVADNRWTRLKGLIGVKQLDAGDGLLIKPCKGVHCMFMSIPIDVLYINADDRVVDLAANMQPNQIGKPRPASHYVIELPAGAIARSGTAIGDQLHVAY